MSNRLPPDVPHPRCYGLPPGAPCPVPDDCDCYMQGRQVRDSTEQCLAYIATVAVAAIVIVGVWFMLEKAFGADVDGSCLTHEQARAKWPTSYLYWRTARHCWYARGGHRIAPKPRPSIEPNGNAVQPKRADTPAPLIAYPDLMAGGGTDDTMLKPGSMTQWPMLDEPREFKPWQERFTLSRQVAPLFRPAHSR